MTRPRLLFLCPADEEPQREEPEEPEEESEPCWERRSLSNLDCNEKAGWVSSAIPTGGLIQPPLQET